MKPRCPSCTSTWVKLRGKGYECRNCKSLFAEPVKRKYTDPLCHVILPTRSNGSGVIALPTYRAQLCRERLLIGPKIDGSNKYTYGRGQR